MLYLALRDPQATLLLLSSQLFPSLGKQPALPSNMTGVHTALYGDSLVLGQDTDCRTHAGVITQGRGTPAAITAKASLSPFQTQQTHPHTLGNTEF